MSLFTLHNKYGEFEEKIPAHARDTRARAKEVNCDRKRSQRITAKMAVRYESVDPLRRADTEDVDPLRRADTESVDSLRRADTESIDSLRRADTEERRMLGDLLDTVFKIGDRIEKKQQIKHDEERQDTAVQRKVEDMKAAGLSPLTDFSGADSSSVGAVSDVQMSSLGDMQRANATQETNEETARLQQEGLKYDNEMKKLDAENHYQEIIDEKERRVKELQSMDDQSEEHKKQIEKENEEIEKLKAERIIMWNEDDRAQEAHEKEMEDKEKQWADSDFEKKYKLLESYIENTYGDYSASLKGFLTTNIAKMTDKEWKEALKMIDEQYAEISGNSAVKKDETPAQTPKTTNTRYSYPEKYDSKRYTVEERQEHLNEYDAYIKEKGLNRFEMPFNKYWEKVGRFKHPVYD